MTQWRKSSHSSGDSGTDCVEVAALVRGVGVRDSKDPDGGHVTIGRASFAALLVRAKAGALDLR
ncbi:DUF397 domain-containing protein [Actinomadura verrucosospora]|uniref:DUF397 domain-containing protein n=1 Tax=Actinomadura verrucosospora TaxID=46165 RepID=UPI001567C457|nr:DUF397 domain-containing protein [Actinomadura verrucosospora]